MEKIKLKVKIKKILPRASLAASLLLSAFLEAGCSSVSNSNQTATAESIMQPIEKCINPSASNKYIQIPIDDGSDTAAIVYDSYASNLIIKGVCVYPTHNPSSSHAAGITNATSPISTQLNRKNCTVTTYKFNYSIIKNGRTIHFAMFSLYNCPSGLQIEGATSIQDRINPPSPGI